MLNPTDAPNIILHQASGSARTAQILANQEHIESLPIDGMVVNVPASWQAMSPDRVVTSAELERDFEPLVEFNAGFEANYVAIFTDDPADLGDDTAWAQVVENWRLIAQEAKEAGFKGIIFDNEEYQGNWINFPEDYPNAEAADLEAYQALASRRGREIMDAVNDVFPEAEVGVLHGPYRAVPRTDGAVEAISLQAGGPERFELDGPFFTGLLEGMGDGQTLIDMGELYALRSREEFAASQAYRSEVVDDQAAEQWEIDPDALARWDEIDFSHTVYTGNFPTGFTQDPDGLRDTTLNALDHSEGAVFIYADWNEVDLFRPNPDNADWIRSLEEIRAARNDREGDQPPVDLEPVEPPVSAGRTAREGTDREDIVVGGDGDEAIFGFGGSDELYGNGGNDLIAPGAGADLVGGGTGYDVIDYAVSSAPVIVNLIQGAGYGGDAQGDTLLGIEGARGSRFDDMLIGGWEASVLLGGAGSDELYGNGGDDYIVGGAGADIVAGSVGVDTAAYTGSRAAVTIDLAQGTASGGDANGDTLLAIENVVGSDFSDTLVGNADENVLLGGAGDDVLTGGVGADVFVFSAQGNDVVTDFEEGIDRYAFETGESSVENLRFELADSGGALITWSTGSVLFEGLTVGSITGGGVDLGFQFGDLDPFGVG